MVDSWTEFETREMHSKWVYSYPMNHMSFNTYKELQSQLGLIYPDLIAEYKRVRKEE